MPISSVPDYNTLKASIITTVASQAEILYNKYSNGVVTAYDKLRFLLLIRYVNYVYDLDVYETYDVLVDYVIGDFVVDSGDYFKCIKTLTVPGIATSDRTYWSPNVSFTYDYDTILDYLNKINRICGTNFEI